MFHVVLFCRSCRCDHRCHGSSSILLSCVDNFLFLFLFLYSVVVLLRCHHLCPSRLRMMLVIAVIWLMKVVSDFVEFSIWGICSCMAIPFSSLALIASACAVSSACFAAILASINKRMPPASPTKSTPESRQNKPKTLHKQKQSMPNSKRD